VDLRIFADAEAVAREARREIVAAMAAARKASRPFALGLAGGRTPRRLYELLAEEASLDWSGVRFFWDERCVPPDDPASNWRLAHDVLLSRIRPAAVHRMRGEADPEAAAREYEVVLEELGEPDLVLLGVGGDGHTASLFPGSPALEEASRLVVPALAPAGVTPRRRLTLTLPALARVRRVLFLVSGWSKREILAALRGGSAEARRLPAALVHASESVSWIADRAAAGTVAGTARR
jgi:6-phosphogluconolactonase